MQISARMEEYGDHQCDYVDKHIIGLLPECLASGAKEAGLTT